MTSVNRSALYWQVVGGVIALVVAGAGEVAAQAVPDALRVVEVHTVPEEPGFGEEFDVRLTLRTGPGILILMPDTLIDSEAVASVGIGSWTAISAPADSTDIVASFPVIGFRAGPLLLPAFEVLLRSGIAAGSERVMRATEAPPELVGGAENLMIALGAVQVGPFPPMAEADSALLPRPPADVLGGDWSIWLILAVGLASVAGVGGGGALLSRWWSMKGAALLRRWRAPSPRQAALDELERIRSNGWHRNGRVDEFYDSSTGTLRRFAGQIDAAWVPALTSGELLARLEERWGPGRTERLRTVIDVSERVKFGDYRPSPEEAERDWVVIRDWVRGCPDP
jgi:hypothetical protein